MKARYILLTLILNTTPAFASMLQLPGDPCRNLNTLCLDENFMTGSSSTTTAGLYGWVFVGGTFGPLASEAGHPGIYRRDTGSSSGTFAYLSAGSTTQSPIAMGTADLFWRFRLNQVDANTSIRIGMMSHHVTQPFAGQYLERLDGETNWFVVTREGGVQTGSRTDTGIAAGTDWVDLRIVRVGNAAVSFYMNNVFIATHTTNVPTTFCFFGLHIINSAAASKTVDLDKAKLIAVN